MVLNSGHKSFCILTPQVAGMGGAQLYTIRRAKYLKQKGLNIVLLVSDTPDFPLKQQLECFEIIKISELVSPVFMFSYSYLNNLLNIIAEKLEIFKHNLVIESHTLMISIWGELLAEKLKCKHIIYPLNERPITYWEFINVKEFFLWKLNRIEFIGPSVSSLRVVLSKYYSNEKAYYSNIGFDPDELPVKSCPSFSELIEKNTFRIGTVSRLSKPYIEELIKSIKHLADKYPEKKITAIIAGDDPDKSIIDKFKKKYTQTGNLEIIFPGYIDQLGKDFFHNLDVFVGMATAAINSISSNCATITVDPITKKSSGFFGLTSKDTMFAERDKLFSLFYWIEIAFTHPEILEEARKAGYEFFRSEYMANVCMQKIEDLIAASDVSKTYWQFPQKYLSSKFLKCRYLIENSEFFKCLKKIYHLRNLLRQC